jgi:hypothetical protein
MTRCFRVVDLRVSIFILLCTLVDFFLSFYPDHLFRSSISFHSAAKDYIVGGDPLVLRLLLVNVWVINLLVFPPGH